MTIRKFLPGEKYGELTILWEGERSEKNLRKVVCQCTCGEIVTRTTKNLHDNSYCGKFVKHDKIMKEKRGETDYSKDGFRVNSSPRAIRINDSHPSYETVEPYRNPYIIPLIIFALVSICFLIFLQK